MGTEHANTEFVLIRAVRAEGAKEVLISCVDECWASGVEACKVVLAVKGWSKVGTQLEDSHILLNSHLLVDDHSSISTSILYWDREVLIEGIL